MRVGIQSDADIAVPHQLLERLGIHTGLRHVAAAGMAADVGSMGIVRTAAVVPASSPPPLPSAR